MHSCALLPNGTHTFFSACFRGVFDHAAINKTGEEASLRDLSRCTFSPFLFPIFYEAPDISGRPMMMVVLRMMMPRQLID